MKKLGIKVGYGQQVASYKRKKALAFLHKVVPEGWFLWVRYGGRWYAILDLVFARQKDALRAAQALTAAGLDNQKALAAADPLQVKQLACEHLQW